MNKRSTSVYGYLINTYDSYLEYNGRKKIAAKSKKKTLFRVSFILTKVVSKVNSNKIAIMSKTNTDCCISCETFIPSEFFKKLKKNTVIKIRHSMN